VSCFVCHYNLLPVHNDLQNPTAPRVGYWLRSTVWSAAAFYMVMGLSGSAYGRCAAAMSMSSNSTDPSNSTSPAPSDIGLSGNILLDFPEDDPLLLVGRLCLAVTLALAFPMLTIPGTCFSFAEMKRPPKRLRHSTSFLPPHHTFPIAARDIVLHCLPANLSLLPRCLSKPRARQHQPPEAEPAPDPANELTEPLLNGDAGRRSDDASADGDAEAAAPLSTSPGPRPADPSFLARLGTAVLVFWSAAAVASCVSSIDVVWDLLGSSLSILLSYLIPCAAYLSVRRQLSVQVRPDDGPTSAHDLSSPRASPWLAGAVLAAFAPLMVGSTANAVRNTFFRPKLA
jgi:hypothetical protein